MIRYQAFFILLLLCVAQTSGESMLDVNWDVERVAAEIVMCESGGRHEGVWGDGGRSYGIAQFQKRTFNWMKNLAGRPELNWKDKDDQLWLLRWGIKNGYSSHWTCAKSCKKR